MEDCIPPTVSISDPKHFSGNVCIDFEESNNQLIIRTEKPGNYTFRIGDVAGKIWQTGNMNSVFEIISTKNLPKGIYILQLYNGSQKNALKFVKF